MDPVVSNQFTGIKKKAFIATPQSSDRSRARQEPLGETGQRIRTDHRPVLSCPGLAWPLISS